MKTSHLFLTLLTALLLLSHTTIAQNVSGLEGQTLRKTEDTGNVIKELFTSQLAGGITGEILDIMVTQDSHEKLGLEIRYEGFEKARLTVAVKDHRKKDQEQRVSPQSFSLQGRSSPLEVTLSLEPSAPEGVTLESAYLELTLTPPAGDPMAQLTKKLTEKAILYHLDKKWKKEISPENITIPVTLEPVGSAADLQQQQIMLAKPKRVPKFSLAIKERLSQRNPQSGAQNGATDKFSADVSSNPIDGTWYNVDKNAKDIVKIVISEGGKKIGVYEKCSPKDCNWGTKALKAGKNPKKYSATYKRGVFTSTLALDFTKDLALMHNKQYYDVKENEVKNIMTGGVFKKTRTLKFIGKLNRNRGNSGTTPQGPDNAPIFLWGDLVSDHDFESPQEITNIKMDIYPDKNPRSGMFYCLPYAYHLRFADGKYQLRTLYGTADGASSGAVRMSATLTPGISTTEMNLMKELLQSYISSHPEYTYKELKIMPYKKLEMTFKSDLGTQYNIPADKINVNVSSSIVEPIEVSWVTDARTKEEMQVALSEGMGIHGTMILAPDSETVQEKEIPVRITLADPLTLGRFTLEPGQWRTERWRNDTPHPLKLNFIHALVIEKKGSTSTPMIYSWSLGNKEVLPGSRVRFDAAKMPEWLEKNNRIERLWIDYSVSDCESCINKVMNELTGGTSGSKVKNITLESLQLFEKSDAAVLQVKIRSRQADPKGNSVVELPVIRIDKDGTTHSAGPLYPPEGQSMSYEYFFTLVMNDGTSYHSDHWTTSRESSVFIGIKTLKDAISGLNAITETE